MITVISRHIQILSQSSQKINSDMSTIISTKIIIQILSQACQTHIQILAQSSQTFLFRYYHNHLKKNRNYENHV